MKGEAFMDAFWLILSIFLVVIWGKLEYDYSKRSKYARDKLEKYRKMAWED